MKRLGVNVKQFQPGDDVFGESGFGAFAEYVCVTEDKLVLKPANISFEEAAAVPVIDRRYSLSAVAEAFQYFEEGHARGKVVITVEHNNK